LAIGIGAVAGWSSAHALFLGFWTLVIWGVLAVSLGLGARRGRAAAAGALFGLVASVVFMITNYGGSAPLLTRTPFFALLGVVGAVCGAPLGLLGAFIGARWAQGT